MSSNNSNNSNKEVIVNNSICDVFNHAQKKHQAITFDEVTFEDKPSRVHPNDVVLTTKLTTKYSLKSTGIMSSAMDTVTEKEMALAMAKMGGVGIIHRNMDPDEQCQMVKWVRNKIHHGGMIEKPYFVVNLVVNTTSFGCTRDGLSSNVTSSNVMA